MNDISETTLRAVGALWDQVVDAATERTATRKFIVFDFSTGGPAEVTGRSIPYPVLLIETMRELRRTVSMN